MAGIDSTGLETKTVQEIVTEVSQDQVDGISDSLNVSSSSPLGQMNASLADQLAALWELAQEAVASQKPGEASGQSLTDVAELTGTIRRGATYSQDYLDLDLDAGTYAIGTLIVHTTTDPTARFANVEEVVSIGAVVEDVLMQAEDAGIVRANAGTLTVIAEPVTGFNAVDADPQDATLGALIESDTALRVRRQSELARAGSSTVEAIRVDVADVADVTYCVVLENDGDAVDGNGQPGHSIQAIVEGGLDADVAEAIFQAKAGGIQAYGSDSEAVVDDMGYSHTIGFTRPSAVTVYYDIELTADADTYPGDSEVKTLLAEWADANHTIGADVVRTHSIFALFDLVPGLIDVTVLDIGVTNGGEVASNLVVAPTARATFDTSRIDLVSTLV